MRFWDTSAVVSLLVEEPRSPLTRVLVAQDLGLTVWWATEVECVSALSRLVRVGDISQEQAADGIGNLEELTGNWIEVDPSARVRRTARRLLLVHELVAADALQLSAAIAAAEDEPTSLEFVSFDQRLRRAASREGFAVVPAQT